MKSIFPRIGLLLCVASLLSLASFNPARAAETPKGEPDIYDESADGTKQISEALALAQKDGKRVLLMFGANWCGWCHKLHALYASDKDIAATLKSNFVLVMIDVNKGHNAAVDQSYGHPIRFGLPVLVVLDAQGKQLTTKNTGELEEDDHHSPTKVLAFLMQWSAGK